MINPAQASSKQRPSTSSPIFEDDNPETML